EAGGGKKIGGKAIREQSHGTLLQSHEHRARPLVRADDASRLKSHPHWWLGRWQKGAGSIEVSVRHRADGNAARDGGGLSRSAAVILGKHAENEVGGIPRAGLAHDVGPISLHRARAQAEPPRGFLGGLAEGDRFEHLGFAHRKAGSISKRKRN